MDRVKLAKRVRGAVVRDCVRGRARIAPPGERIATEPWYGRRASALVVSCVRSQESPYAIVSDSCLGRCAGMLEIARLTKRFKDRMVLDDVSLRVGEGKYSVTLVLTVRARRP